MGKSRKQVTFIWTGMLIMNMLVYSNLLSGQANNIAAYGNNRTIRSSNHLSTSDEGTLIGSVDVCDSFLYFTKVDLYQNPLWAIEVTIPVGYGVEDAFIMKELSDGSVIALLKGTPLIFRISPNGSIIWRKQLKDMTVVSSWYGNNGYDLLVLPGDRIVICGTAQPVAFFAQRGWVCSLDINGGCLWSKAYDSGSFDCFNCIAEANDGGFTVIGDAQSGTTSALHHFDSAGTLLWSRFYSKSVYPYMTYSRLIATSDDGYMMVGCTAILQDVAAIKFDSTGLCQWSCVYSSQSYCELTDVCENAQGYVACGVVNTPAGGHGLVLCLNRMSGTILWKTTISHLNSTTPSTFPFLSIDANNAGITACAPSSYLYTGWNFPHLVHFNVNGDIYCDSTIVSVNSNTANLLTSVNGAITVLPGDTVFTAEINSCTPRVTTTYFACPVGFPEWELDEELNVFPNPASGIFTISNVSAGSHVSIRTITGEVVFDETASYSTMTINLVGRAPGIYIVQAGELTQRITLIGNN